MCVCMFYCQNLNDGEMVIRSLWIIVCLRLCVYACTCSCMWVGTCLSVSMCMLRNVCMCVCVCANVMYDVCIM